MTNIFKVQANLMVTIVAYQCLCMKYVYPRRSPDDYLLKPDLSRSVVVLGGDIWSGGGAGERWRAGRAVRRVHMSSLRETTPNK